MLCFCTQSSRSVRSLCCEALRGAINCTRRNSIWLKIVISNIFRQLHPWGRREIIWCVNECHITVTMYAHMMYSCSSLWLKCGSQIPRAVLSSYSSAATRSGRAMPRWIKIGFMHSYSSPLLIHLLFGDWRLMASTCFQVLSGRRSALLVSSTTSGTGRSWSSSTLRRSVGRRDVARVMWSRRVWSAAFNPLHRSRLLTNSISISSIISLTSVNQSDFIF